MTTYDNCGICLDELIDVNPIYFNKWADSKDCKCKILYHKKCLIEWEKHKTYKQCPICNISIKNNTESYIDVFLKYICNIIDSYIYDSMISVPIDNIYYKFLVMLIYIIISFVFTVFIFIPCFFLKLISEKLNI